MNLGFTIDYVDGRFFAYCHHCELVQVRTSDRFGLVLAANRHVELRHPERV